MSLHLSYYRLRLHRRLCISEEILDEVKRVLKRPKFNYPPEIIQIITHELTIISDLLTPVEKITVIKADPEDNRVLACAVEGDVGCIITGDSHLLELESFENIKKLTPSQFIDRGIINK